MAKTARAVPKRRPSSPSFPALVKRYQDEIERGLQAADHIERHRTLQRTLNPYHLAHLQRFFGKRPLTSIDTAATTEYAMRRLEAGEERDIVDEELRGLSRLLTFAVELGWLDRHPAIYFVPRPRPASARRDLRPARWFRHASPTPSTPRGGATQGASRRRGRRPGLNNAEFMAHWEQHRPTDRWRGSDQERADLLSTALGRRITHDQVRLARFRLGLPASTLNAE